MSNRLPPGLSYPIIGEQRLFYKPLCNPYRQPWPNRSSSRTPQALAAEESPGTEGAWPSPVPARISRHADETCFPGEPLLEREASWAHRNVRRDGAREQGTAMPLLSQDFLLRPGPAGYGNWIDWGAAKASTKSSRTIQRLSRIGKINLAKDCCCSIIEPVTH